MNQNILVGLEQQAEKLVLQIPAALDSNEYTSLFNEKFAELIVQECLDTIQRGIDNGGGANEDIVLAGKLALFYAYRNIQYRFGMGDYKDQEHFGIN